MSRRALTVAPLTADAAIPVTAVGARLQVMAVADDRLLATVVAVTRRRAAMVVAVDRRTAVDPRTVVVAAVDPTVADRTAGITKTFRAHPVV